MKSNESNVVQALAAKAPNVEVTQSSGEPGASSYIRMRGSHHPRQHAAAVRRGWRPDRQLELLDDELQPDGRTHRG
jgi:hypothetical protein